MRRFGAAHEAFTKALRLFRKKLRKRGIALAEEFEDAFRRGLRLFPAGLTEFDPDYREFFPALWEYQSVREQVDDRQPKVFAEFRQWEENWSPVFANGKASKEDTAKYQAEYAQWVERLCAPPVSTPAGWEGERPDYVLDSLEAIEQWLEGQLSLLRFVANMLGWDRAKNSAAIAYQSIRNVYRVFDALRVNDRPPRPVETDVARQAEAALSDLLAWLRSQVDVSEAISAGDGANRRTSPRHAKKKRGAPKQGFTKQRVEFAEPLINEGLSWAEIANAYRDKHPEDTEATNDKIRLAYHREFSPK
jgi:hypothetical protein